MTPNKHYFISWEEFHRDTRNLAQRLLPVERWQGNIAITRGGLIPTAILVRESDLRFVDTIWVKSYIDTGKATEIELIKGVDGDGEEMLLVDDLVDTDNIAKFVKAQKAQLQRVTPLVDRIDE